MGKNDASSGGIGFAGLLAVLFIGLKLTHYVTWSWVWVLSPIWIPWGLAGAVCVVALGVWGAGSLARGLGEIRQARKFNKMLRKGKQ